ncbi:ATP-binding protein [Burkholderia plantarii]|uniref:ATP-binding protein n=1 Tax=Burkholderia plantarii TaxID=41899 RepID=UPI0018DDE810|nr:ATP-binding protein [Burkholderia plantarii]MBI0327664.1 ATP-binding protein [Burkholderia plantarii]
MTAVANQEQELLNRVADGRLAGKPVDAILKTNARVFARITDGIYREPASALRELIANAYDADSTDVRIDTDAPRFSRIVVRDNGRGLSEEGLVHVICNIGGSLKRTAAGKNFHVTSDHDPTRSPSGRKLIGKLGIGLFSVSQLTHHLVIVTKVRGESVRRVCDIMLMPQSEEYLSDGDEAKEFVTGTAQITSIPAEDVDSQGTEITLHDIRPYVRNELRSASRWAALKEELKRTSALERARSGESRLEEITLIEEIEDDDDEFRSVPKEPLFHVGEVDANNSERLEQPARLPWLASDSPRDKFVKLVEGVRNAPINPVREKIKIREVLDSYLQMIWTISLCVPLPYVKEHPFSLTKDAGIPIFTISNKAGGRAEELELTADETIAQALDLQTGDGNASDFVVIVDGIQLCRPIMFPPELVVGEESPLLFVGKLNSDLTTIPKEYRGGPIEFEAYLYWTKRILPAEHNGVMIRVNGASGILFDEYFLKYQVSEQTRLRQITAEIFITRGIDAAQNIDRESFNIAHPHYQVLANWLHHALKQLNTRHKSLQKGRSDSNLSRKKEEAKQKLDRIVSSVSNVGSMGQRGTSVEFVEGVHRDLLSIATEVVSLERSKIFASRAGLKAVTKSEKLKESLFEEKIRAVAQVLNDFGLLSGLDEQTRERLISAIVEIFSVELNK